MAGSGTTGDSMTPPLAAVSGRPWPGRAQSAQARAGVGHVVRRQAHVMQGYGAGAMAGLNQLKGCKAASS
jgi:hypothetical protein